MQMALAPPLVVAAQESDLPPTTSRVYPGPSGKLIYTPDEQGNTILDFSHAGYGGGGTPIPFVPVKETVWPVAGDNTANLQAAIDRVSALPLDKTGFRGAVLTKMGYYKMATPLKIQSSGVVLRGEGLGETGTVLIGTGNPRSGATGGRGGPGGGQPTLVTIGAASGWAAREETKQALSDEYVPVGARALRVASAKDFKPGDTVVVRRAGVENLRGMSEYDQTRRSVEYGNMDRQNYVGEEYYSDEDHYWNFITINIRRTRGCGMSQLSTSPTAWWGPSAERNGSRFRTACLASRSLGAWEPDDSRSGSLDSSRLSSAARPTRGGTRS